MTFTELQPLLMFVVFTGLTSVIAAAKGRGFVGVQEPLNEGRFQVGEEAVNTLNSSLTTVFLPIIFIIVLVVGLPTNAMAVWIFLFRTKKKHPAAIYMANLALADLLFVVWTPLKIAYHLKGNNWTFGEGMCRVLVSFFYGNMYGSILFIMCLSVQRYWVVVHPLSQQRKNNRMAIAASISIWAFIWLTTVPLYMYDQTVMLKQPNITTCHDVTIIHDLEKPFDDVKYVFSYFLLMAVVAFLIPSLVIIVAYILLLRALNISMEDNSSGKNRRKAVILIFTVLVTFLICFVPSNIMLVIHYSLLKNGKVNNGYAFYITTLCLASLNSCMDPFIYYYVSDDFREHVKNTLLCRSSRTVERMRVSFSSLKYSKKSNMYSSNSGNTQSSSC